VAQFQPRGGNNRDVHQIFAVSRQKFAVRGGFLSSNLIGFFLVNHNLIEVYKSESQQQIYHLLSQQ
jgi:hypothetical protein